MQRKIKNVILVEDDDNHAEIFSFYALAYDPELVIRRVCDGEAAMRLIETEGRGLIPEVDIIFLDLNLPKFSGLEILKRLVSCPSAKAIPTVVLTSSDSDRDVTAAFLMGANSYLRKPLQTDVFKPLITKTLSYWSMNERSPQLDLEDRCTS